MAANELRTGSEPPLPGSHRADEAVAGHCRWRGSANGYCGPAVSS